MRTGSLEIISKELDTLTVEQKQQLIDQLARSLKNGKEHSSKDKQKALEALRKELATLPVNNSADGFSNRDHDSQIYGAST